MTDLVRILALWRELEAAGAGYVLATVVGVEGSSYRKPGALMLLTADGRRIGTVSGGCLEAQVASRAWWLTSNGPVVERYTTTEEDGDRPYGSGCGGVIFLLLERRATAGPFLAAVEQAFNRRIPLSAAVALDGPQIGHRVFAGVDPRGLQGLEGNDDEAGPIDEFLQGLAERAIERRVPIESEFTFDNVRIKAWADYRPARPALAIFGAGDDAQPLLRLAKELGWFVTVADGRSQLTTRERFARADELCTLAINDLPGVGLKQNPPPFASLRRENAAVVMTHSFEQDSKILASLLALEAPPGYIGVLGPQRRTRELLAEAARLLKLPASAIAAQTERWLLWLHAPTGLDLGADSPETIALSVLSEIQKYRTAATALPLREVRAAQVTASG
jgi:xanthine dehydrogenase accessory factor